MPARDAAGNRASEMRPDPFLGEAAVSVSPEGRVVIPSMWRPGCADGLFTCRGINANCLMLLPMWRWASIRELLVSSDPLDERANLLQRFFGSGFETTLDRQGRITIPRSLRDRAGIQSDAVMFGAGDRLELWDPQAREEYEKEAFSPEALTETVLREAL
jgi:MraZ protein